MNNRPLTVTLIGWLYIAVGTAGFVLHSREIHFHQPFSTAHIWIALLSLLALLSGIFLLRGRTWAQWLTLAWIGAHVAISFLNSWREVAMHSFIFLLIALALFHPAARVYFRGQRDIPPPV